MSLTEQEPRFAGNQSRITSGVFERVSQGGKKKERRRVLINQLHFFKHCGMFTGVLTIHECLTGTFVILYTL